ncbi:hypothetical protein OQX63_10080 [Pedobacter sp. PF22-3]|uniref:hypothetical protein n=1 Tax=Pedobacter sp. PF22-3 TaxID=2994467 RepID=UPI00224680A6|nr:hypothetical protein [Pedobacter sp. PF22-3]MCX2493821.1 hypothetical protein [Pedobacter sp. PF22-3]
MKNKYLTVWIIPILLLGASCKKQEKLSQVELAKKIQKTDLVGNWVPTKIETLFIDKKNQKTSRVDSSDYVKFYTPAYKFTSDQVNEDHKSWDYSVVISDKSYILEYLKFGVLQHYEILKLNSDQLILKSINKEESGIRTEVIYFKKN